MGKGASDLGVALGVADHSKGPGSLRAGIGLEGADFGNQFLRAIGSLGLGFGAIEILGAGLEAFDTKFMKRAFAGGFESLFAFGGFSIVEGAGGTLGSLPHDRDASFGGELQVGRDDPLERKVGRKILGGGLDQFGIVAELMRDSIRGGHIFVNGGRDQLSGEGVVFIAIKIAGDEKPGILRVDNGSAGDFG